jgi:hypothetical protein
VLTRLQSFVNLQASEFAATQVVPTAGTQFGYQGSRGVYVRAERGSLPPRASDMLAVRNRAIDGIGLSPTRFAALPAATGNCTPSPSQIPYVNLSIHTARAIARRLPPSIGDRVPPVAG